MKFLLVISMLSAATAQFSLPSIHQLSQMAERRLDANFSADDGYSYSYSDDFMSNECQTEFLLVTACYMTNPATCDAFTCTCADDDACMVGDDDDDDDGDDDDFSPTSCDDVNADGETAYSATCTMLTNTECSVCTECVSVMQSYSVCYMEAMMSAEFSLTCDLEDSCSYASVSSANKAATAVSVLMGVLMFGTALAGLA